MKRSTERDRGQSRTASVDTDPSDPKYLVAQKRGDAVQCSEGPVQNGGTTSVTASDENLRKASNVDTSIWQRQFSMFIIKTLWKLAGPMAATGRAFELLLNVLSANGGFRKTLCRYFFAKCDLVVPVQGSENYFSLNFQLDPRVDLYQDIPESGAGNSSTANAIPFPGPDPGSRATADVCVMASKLVYENGAVIKKVVNDRWKMNFVGFYECWNEFLKKESTQVFIFTDKPPPDAKAVVVAWRGTEVFDAYDWSSDVDFSWFHLERMGKVHVGFLEALGLGDRNQMNTFTNMQENASKNTNNREVGSTSGLPEHVINASDKILAYDAITKMVRDLLVDNAEAKLYLTGHSLGGALSTLYTAMLYYNGEREITDKLAAVYTFGQPRVGDETFANYMHRTLSVSRYFRIVYSHDIVPRVPFDNSLFQFKHFGYCFYYNCAYDGQTLSEAPNRNYFVMTDLLIMHWHAVWELLQSLLISYTHGALYRESNICTMVRTIGLCLPGVAAHSLTNYINAVRLGRSPLVATLDKSFRKIEEEIHIIERSARTVKQVVLSYLRTAGLSANRAWVREGMVRSIKKTLTCSSQELLQDS